MGDARNVASWVWEHLRVTVDPTFGIDAQPLSVVELFADGALEWAIKGHLTSSSEGLTGDVPKYGPPFGGDALEPQYSAASRHPSS